MEGEKKDREKHWGKKKKKKTKKQNKTKTKTNKQTNKQKRKNPYTIKGALTTFQKVVLVRK